MRVYRTYLIDSAERVARVFEADAPDDATAIRRAWAFSPDWPAVEIWRGGSLLARLGAEFLLPAA